MQRLDNRKVDELRPVSFELGIAPHADASVLCSFGNTKVICSAIVEDDVPRWMKHQGVKGGWVTAEYSMLPYSTLERKRRDVNRGQIDGRSSEIQRLISRSLRAVIDLSALGRRTIWLDCDVLQADGGTRSASICGAAVVSSLVTQCLLKEGKVKTNPMQSLVAAVSAGIFQDTPLLDMNYQEDKDASVDCNIVMTEQLHNVELQASGESSTFSDEELSAIRSLSKKGISEIICLQKQAIQSVAMESNTQNFNFSGKGAELNF